MRDRNNGTKKRERGRTNIETLWTRTNDGSAIWIILCIQMPDPIKETAPLLEISHYELLFLRRRPKRLRRSIGCHSHVMMEIVRSSLEIYLSIILLLLSSLFYWFDNLIMMTINVINRKLRGWKHKTNIFSYFLTNIYKFSRNLLNDVANAIY